MNKYRDKLVIQNICIAFCCFLLVVVSVLGAVGVFTPVGNAHWGDFWNGMLTGASFGVCGVMIATLVRNILALRNEARLKKLYIRENDERTKIIWTDARRTAYQVMVIVQLLAGLIAGYFNITVCITLIASATVSSFVGLGFVLYYYLKY